MNSFYGGRRGSSVQIKKTFEHCDQINSQAIATLDYNDYFYCIEDGYVYRKIVSSPKFEKAFLMGIISGSGSLEWNDIFD